jgi:predicted metal-dependent phosphoesterase TrpH
MSRSFRYPSTGRWFKGNTHIHTRASDGGMSVTEIARLYAGADYDFLCCTDHWVASAMSRFEESFPLLWIDGIELDGQDSRGEAYHIVCLGRAAADFTGRMDLTQGVDRMRQAGALVILAHPEWTGNSLDPELAGRCDGVEIYNHVCRWLNGKWSGRLHWNAQLKAGRPMLGFAVDDAHLRPEHPGWNGGWIQVLASGLRNRTDPGGHSERTFLLILRPGNPADRSARWADRVGDFAGAVCPIGGRRFDRGAAGPF